MWSYERRGFLAALGGAVLVAGCGFAPDYASGGPGRALRNAVLADEPTGRDAYDLVASLEDRLGRPTAPRYALAYTITVTDTGTGFTADAVTTRQRLEGRLGYVLTDIATGAELATGEVRNFTGYSTTSTQLATRSAMEDARRRLMRMLADQMVTRLVASMPR